MPLLKLIPPLRGVSDVRPFMEQAGDTAPLDAIRNVLPQGRGAFRQTMGPRGGTVAAFAAIGDGQPIQSLDIMPRVSGTVYTPGTPTDAIDGENRDSRGLRGQAWVLDGNLAMRRAFNTRPSESGFICGWHPGGNLAAVGTIGTGGPFSTITTYITLVNVATGATVWERRLPDYQADDVFNSGARELAANRVKVYNTFTYVCVGPYIYVIRTSDGVYLKRYTIGTTGWAWEVMDCTVRPDGRLAVLFFGTPTGITSSYSAGAYWRSGIALFDIAADTEVMGDSLSVVQFGAKADVSYTYYEDHNYLRFSEHLTRQPRGCIPYAMAVDNAGRIAVGFTNSGFGNSDAIPPHGSFRSTVAMFSAGTSTAAKVWEHDTDSRLENWLSTGWWNDIPIQADGTPIGSPPAGPEPSVNALCMNPSTGDVFVGGKLNNAGVNVFGVNADGSRRWSASVGGMVYQHGIGYDAANGLVVVVGERNATWTGAAGRLANLWRIDASSGEIVGHYDLNEVVSSFGVDVNATGQILFVTGFVT